MQIASDELTGARQIKRWIRFNYFVAEICIERGRTHLKTKSFFFFCLQSKHEVFEVEMLCPYFIVFHQIFGLKSDFGLIVRQHKIRLL